MAGETVDDKVRRYLAEGRLTVEHVVGDDVRARCLGRRGAKYELGIEDGHWFCDCPAHGRCAHEAALELVTAGRRFR